MKKQTGIWIDGSKAIIVTFSGTEHNVTEINSDIENRIYHEKEGDKGSFMGSRHINNEKKFDERKKHQVDHFLDNVIEQVKAHDELYIFGPAEIKSKLKHHIENEGDALKNKLKSVESAEEMSLHQVIARMRKFYGIA